MYNYNTLSRKELDRQVIDTIINILHADNPREKRHSENVMKLCEKIGRKINMTEPELIKLKRDGYYHDIGKVVLDKKILYKKGRLRRRKKRSAGDSAIATEFSIS